MLVLPLGNSESILNVVLFETIVLKNIFLQLKNKGGVSFEY